MNDKTRAAYRRILACASKEFESRETYECIKVIELIIADFQGMKEAFVRLELYDDEK